MKKLLLLHGAIGAKDQLAPLAGSLQDSYEIYTLNFPGHGGEPAPSVFSIEVFADHVLRWLEENRISTIDVFGYSMGGYVALYLAKHHPQKIGRLFTLATKFSWDQATSQKEITMLDPTRIEEKLPAFAKALEERHQPNDWKHVLAATAQMMIDLGKKNTLSLEDYTPIASSALICIGDRDKMVTLEETIAVYRQLKNGQMLILPNTPHPLEQVSLERLSSEVRSFFN
jgi:pimeloyl-ACP methyl ester carboxylesterase